MTLECPKCGSDEVRLSRRRSAVTRLLQIFGVYHFRCEDCGWLFKDNIHNLTHLPFAKCPTCHRMDLSRWSRTHYHPPFSTRFMLAIGAKAVRCEYCRNNFWAFRLVKEKFDKAKRMARSRVVIPAPPSIEAMRRVEAEQEAISGPR